ELRLRSRLEGVKLLDLCKLLKLPLCCVLVLKFYGLPFSPVGSTLKVVLLHHLKVSADLRCVGVKQLLKYLYLPLSNPERDPANQHIHKGRSHLSLIRHHSFDRAHTSDKMNLAQRNHVFGQVLSKFILSPAQIAEFADHVT